MTTIQTLKVENVQGIPTAETLEFGGSSLLLYGENGTGKSSFIAATELLLTGDVESVPREGGGFNYRIRNRDHLEDEAEVTVRLENGATLSRADNNDPEVDRDGEAWFSAMEAHVPILYRKDLLDFIEGTPGERYTEISQWIGHGDIDKAFETIREAHTIAEERRDSAQRDREKLTSSFNDELDIEQVPQTFAETVASVQDPLRDAGVDLPEDAEAAADLAKGLKSDLPPALPDAAKDLRESLQTWEGGFPDDLSTKLEALREAKQERDQLLQQHAEGADELEGVLDRAIAYFEAVDADDCPVCERGNLREDLVDRLEERKEPLRDLAEARDKVSEKRETLGKAIQSEKSKWSDETTAFDQDQVQAYHDLRTRVTGILDGLEENGPPETWELGEICRELAGAIDALESEIGSEHQEKKDEARKILKQLAEWPDLTEKRRALQRAEEVFQTTEALYRAAQDTRHAMFQDRLDEIVDSVQDFYTAIHPGEGVKSIDLEMPDPTEGGLTDKQAKIRFQFDGQDPEDPRVHLSDGHLDTLGLAFFLMNQKREMEEGEIDEPPMLVLDDVISSVDAPHRRRVARELLGRFDDWQLFITTHDKIWFDRLQTLARIEGHQLQKQVIRWWTRAEGPELRDFEDFYESLQRRLEEKDSAQALAANAGVLLEQVCDEVRTRFGLSIKAKIGDNYSLGDIFPKIKSKLTKSPENSKALLPGWYQQNSDIVDDLDAMLEGRENLRNVVGAHWNQVALEFSETEAEDFARQAIALYEAFHCTEGDCGRQVFPIEPGRAPARCRCGALTYPLEDDGEVAEGAE